MTRVMGPMPYIEKQVGVGISENEGSAAFFIGCVCNGVFPLIENATRLNIDLVKTRFGYTCIACTF